MGAQRLLAALLPVGLALLIAFHSGPQSVLHKQLDVWPVGQQYLQRAHTASHQLHSQLLEAARQLRQQVEKLAGRKLPWAAHQAPGSIAGSAPPEVRSFPAMGPAWLWWWGRVGFVRSGVCTL